MRNNFTENGNGSSVEIEFYYDRDMGQHDFDENLKRIDGNRFFYIDFGNLKPVELEEMYIVTDETREEMIKLLKEENKYSDEEYKSIDKMTNEELKNEFVMTENDNYFDCDSEDLFEFDSINFGMIETRGYSQGDYAEVYFKKEDKEKGIYEPKKEDIDHLFWDSPLFFSATIDETKVFSSGGEILANTYLPEDEAKEEILSKMKKELNKDQFEAFAELFEGMNAEYN